MEVLNSNISKKKARPVKVIQFGEGNFLRGFVDYFIDIANETNHFNGDIVLIKPIEYGNLDYFYEQDYRYTVSLRGLADGKEQILNRVITSVTDVVDAYKNYESYAGLAKLDTLRFVVSNTTEAGIVYDDTDRMDFNPPKSFPGKLTKFLYERYLHFKGDPSKGLIILPVELIDDNGIHLKEIVHKLVRLWNLEEDFTRWLTKSCTFCSTLVDRIITGYPKDEAERMWTELGYTDHLIVTGEPFALWVIESDKEIEQEFPLKEAGLPVIFTDNQKPYKQRKVRILNGAHTSFALASFLAGNDYVLDSMSDMEVKQFMTKTIYEEIIPTLQLSKSDLTSFAEAVIERFHNPYIKHSLLSISLNSVSKWKARCLPSLLEYVERFSELPPRLTFSLAALLEFYSGREMKDGVLIGHRGNEEYPIKDDYEILMFFERYSDDNLSELIVKFLSNEAFWDQDLSKIPNLTEAITDYLTEIRTVGMRKSLSKLS